jgi:hypothetical protein
VLEISAQHAMSKINTEGALHLLKWARRSIVLTFSRNTALNSNFFMLRLQHIEKARSVK